MPINPDTTLIPEVGFIPDAVTGIFGFAMGFAIVESHSLKTRAIAGLIGIVLPALLMLGGINTNQPQAVEIGASGFIGTCTGILTAMVHLSRQPHCPILRH